MRAQAPGSWFVIGVLASACTGSGSEPRSELRNGDMVKVVEVVKGDEVVVAAAGVEARVRLVGIHAFAPVMEDPQVHALSAGATSALEAWVAGREARVTLDHTAKDGNGRYLAYLQVEGADIASRLVEQGWAVVYTEFPFDREADYLRIEREARAALRNLWALQPAAELVRGLRRQWREAREGAGRTVVADAILE